MVAYSIIKEGYLLEFTYQEANEWLILKIKIDK